MMPMAGGKLISKETNTQSNDSRWDCSLKNLPGSLRCFSDQRRRRTLRSSLHRPADKMYTEWISQFKVLTKTSWDIFWTILYIMSNHTAEYAGKMTWLNMSSKPHLPHVKDWVGAKLKIRLQKKSFCNFPSQHRSHLTDELFSNTIINEWTDQSNLSIKFYWANH